MVLLTFLLLLLSLSLGYINIKINTLTQVTNANLYK